MNHLIFVTGNAKKQTEISDIIMQEFTKSKFYGTALSLHFYKPSKDIPEIQSINTSEVAEAKAITTAKIIEEDVEFMKSLQPCQNIYVLVDDTGLYAKTSPLLRKTFNGIGYPGALIKHYMHSSEDPCKTICQEFGGSIAFAEVSIGIHNITLNHSYHATGRVEGYIPFEPLYNTNGENFGFDPCFVPRMNNFDETESSDEFHLYYKETSYAQLKDKNKYSMRKIAICKALEQIYFDIIIIQHKSKV